MAGADLSGGLGSGASGAGALGGGAGAIGPDYLATPSLVWVVEVHDRDSLPLDLRAGPVGLGCGPVIWSTRDLAAVPFRTGPRAERRRYDDVVRAHGRTALFRLNESTGSTTVAAEVDTGAAMAMSWLGGGTITRGPGALVADPAGALAFDGAHHLEMAPDDGRLDLGTGNVSFSAWFRTAAAAGCIYGKADDSGVANGCLIETNAGVPRIRVTGTVLASCGVAANDDTWHHFAAVIDRGAQQVMVCLDGTERSRVNASALGSTNLNSIWPATIGGYVPGTGVVLRWTGQLARVCRFGRALTSAEVMEQYRTGAVWWSRVSAEARVLGEPVLQQTAPLEFDGVQPLATFTFQASNHDGALTPWLDGEVRGKVVRAHLHDVLTGETQEDVFYGEVAAIGQRGRVVTLRCSELPLWHQTERVPRRRIVGSTEINERHTAQDPDMPLTRGWGVCTNLPGRNVAWGPLDENDPRDGWRYAVGAGNWGVAWINVAGFPLGVTEINGVPVMDESEFLLDYRAMIDGEAATVCKLLRAPDGPVTFTARRLPNITPATRFEWDWMRGFGEKLHGMHARAGTVRGLSGITAGSLRSNDATREFDLTDTDGLAVGAVLGAVQFTGGAYLEAGPVPVAAQYQTFTVSCEVQGVPGVQYPYGTLVCGPFSPLVSSGDVPSWRVRFRDDVQGQLQFVYRTGVNTERVVNGPIVSGWIGDQFVEVTKTPTQVILRLNEQTVATQFNEVPIVYPTSGPVSALMLFGRSISVTNPDLAHATLGWTRLAVDTPSFAESARREALLRGNPVECLREFVEQELRQPCETVSWYNAAVAITTAAGIDDGFSLLYRHAIRYDGALAEDVGAGDALAALSRFRDPLLRRSSGGITIALPGPTTTTGAFSSGAPYQNIRPDPECVRPSTGEAVRTLVVAYDPSRDPVAGQLRAGERSERQSLRFALAPVGRDELPFELPFVRRARCADIIGEFAQQRLRARSRVYAFETGHEARGRRCRDVVAVTLPQFGMVSSPVELLSVATSPARVALQATPYDPTVFAYTAGRDLPVPPSLGLQPLELGTHPAVVWDNTTRILRLALQTLLVEVPTRDGVRTAWDTVVGAATHWQAVASVSASEYIQTPDNTDIDVFGAAGILPLLPSGWGISGVRVAVDAQLINDGGGAPVRIVAPVLKAHNALITDAAEFAVTTTLATYVATVDRHPTGRRWLPTDIPPLEFGVRAFTSAPGEEIRVTSCTRTIIVEPPGKPSGFGYLRLWVVATASPAPDPDITSPTFELDGTTTTWAGPAGAYDAYAAVYERGKRRVAFLGPFPFTVT